MLMFKYLVVVAVAAKASADLWSDSELPPVLSSLESATVDGGLEAFQGLVEGTDTPEESLRKELAETNDDAHFLAMWGSKPLPHVVHPATIDPDAARVVVHPATIDPDAARVVVHPATIDPDVARVVVDLMIIDEAKAIEESGEPPAWMTQDQTIPSASTNEPNEYHPTQVPSTQSPTTEAPIDIHPVPEPTNPESPVDDPSIHYTAEPQVVDATADISTTAAPSPTSAPSTGSNPDVVVVAVAAEPTADTGKSSSSSGAVAAAVAGGVCALVVAAVGVAVMVKRRREQRELESFATPVPGKDDSLVSEPKESSTTVAAMDTII